MERFSNEAPNLSGTKQVSIRETLDGFTNGIKVFWARNEGLISRHQQIMPK